MNFWQIRRQLQDILYEPKKEKVERLLSAFRFEWKDIASGLLAYLNKNYLEHEADRRRWIFCYCQNVMYGYINTNNYIESWYKMLKKHFFKNKQQRRLDSIIHILTKKTVSHFQQICIRHTVQVERITPRRWRELLAKIAAKNYMERILAYNPGKYFLR